MGKLPSVGSRLSHGAADFIDEERIHGLLNQTADPAAVSDILAKSLAREPLSPEETAALINARDPERIAEMFEAARRLKRDVYGNRIVLFAPLYIGNHCLNDCLYCGFRRSNPDSVRRTLDAQEVQGQVEALVGKGHKRLILVFGEHPAYDAQFIADSARLVYSVKKGKGEIRRVNINAAPLDHEGYRIVKGAGIGTYQVFQETYHHGTYRAMHPATTRKADYLWRLDALDRAMEAGCDDVGIGALFGLYDWRFEVLGLVSHGRHLMEKYGCGPHTISFPRLQPASNVTLDGRWFVGDLDFKRLVVILRLSVPYTGMILTARETPQIRNDLMEYGVSQIDAGSRIEIGGYTEAGDSQQQVREREQFELGDIRTLEEVIRMLLTEGFIPSFCTSCYRLGRTGEAFMEYAVPGFIRNFCTPNALSTLREYLVDYASPETRRLGDDLIRRELGKIPEGKRKKNLIHRLELIETTERRDLYL